MSIRSRIVRGVGYGALAICTVGFIIPAEQPVATPYARGGGAWQSISNKKIKRKPRDKFEEFQILIDGMIVDIIPDVSITTKQPRSRAERRASEEFLLIL
jgi:hypothetical protein